MVHASTGEIEFDLASHQINKFGSNELQTGAGGKVKQMVSTVTGAVATGTTQIPQDDTIPQNTEGDEYMTLAITPVSATSNLKIQVTAHFAVNGGANVAMALFVDSTANALAVAAHESGAVSGAPIHATLTHVVASASTSARTYKVRAGPNGGVTVTFNGAGGARLFGGVYTSSIVITEIEA
ncbi:MAG: hypothetical protein FJ029_16295 [Actinobacteria bacterium]|nr:hypothetical protein [Actinomycetota bacterium]